MADQLLPMPSSIPQNDPSSGDAHGLLVPKPFAVPLQKQTTGRNDKEKFKKESILGDGTGSLMLPNFGFQRGLTKQEEREMQD